MADWITTYGGIHFFPLEPEADKIEITDVAHALSLICRGNGHVKTFFSVGQHCIHCALEAEARGYGSRIALACLLHDASEAYMSDVPRPFKQHLSDYISHEKTLLDIVYTKYLGSRLDEEEEKKDIWSCLKDIIGNFDGVTCTKRWCPGTGSKAFNETGREDEIVR